MRARACFIKGIVPPSPEYPFQVVLVIDADNGDITVTNDAEAVVEEIASTTAGFNRETRILAWGTDHAWTQLIHDGAKFERFHNLRASRYADQAMNESTPNA